MTLEKPSLATRLLHLFCPSHLLEEIEGDLMQRYEKDVKEFGERKAKCKLIWNTLRYLRPGIILRNNITSMSMLVTTNHFKLAWRNLLRHPVFSLINLFGLSTGMAVCLIITNYVLFEKSYDNFHENSSSIYRIVYSRYIDGEFQFSKAQVFPAIAETLAQTIPEVQSASRMFPVTTHVEALLAVEGMEKNFIESKVFSVDSTFLRVFSLPLVQGNPVTALAGVNKFLLSKSTAKKYFGNQDPIGKIIHWKGMGDYEVTGVFEDLPENSHMHFNILTSWIQVYGERSAWNWDGFYTYLLLTPNANVIQTEKLIQQLLDEKLKSIPNADRIVSEFRLQPLKDIHLRSRLEGEMEANNNDTIVNALQVVALLILLLATINYINLSFARTVKRMKEIGVRKIAGSSKSQLIGLFFIESLTYNVLCLAAALLLFFATNQFINELVGKQISPLLWLHPFTTAKYLLPTVILITFISSYVPAKTLVASKSTDTFKGKISVSSSRSIFRRSLLTFQFLVTIILVTGTIIIQKQIAFMQNQNLGFDDQNLVIKSFAEVGAEMDSTYTGKMTVFKNKVKELADVKNATISSNIPGRENEWIGRLRKPGMDEELITAVRTRIDENFIDTYNLSLVAGKNFTNEIPNQLILNQTAVKMLGFKNEKEAIGHKLSDYFEVVGVVNDYHEQSVQRPIRPSMFTCGQGYMKFITVKIQSSNFENTVNQLQKEWESVYPDKPFDYFFLNDYFNNQYQNEKQLSKVFSYFSVIGIVIACLGLFGFTYYVSHQRIKEIGIRKALGATGSHLIRLLSLEYFALLAIAGIAAVPISLILSNEWLSNYTLRVHPGISLFVAPILVVGVFTFLSILFLLLKVISKNPSESLKYE